jgi:hypothetical protein
MGTKIIVVSLLLVLNISIVSLAQKLPVKQQTSVIAPVGVKVDGKITEWGNLQAYNPATEISYTIANDNDKLYLVCSATVVEVIQKIQLGGITLSISPVDKKSVIEPVAITYPIVPWATVQINYDLRPKAPLDESTVSLINNKISGHLKEIKITGANEFPDGTVPVYNDKGIIGAHYVGSNKVYTYELAFPLSLISHLVNNQGTFNYKVQVNGMQTKGSKVVVAGGRIGDVIVPSDQEQPHDALFDMSPTYFNATYTLAKK